MSLYNSALSYARIVDPDNYLYGETKKNAELVFKVMNENPTFGSGRLNRIEARLMSHFPG